MLSADGYRTKVTKTGDVAWRFELRAANAEEVSLAGDGYHSREAARLAAFDAITDLLLRQDERTTPTNV
ncbi:hypothetical protein [Ralstonia sp. A12]|uniref:hypothetical protein n=1 Tax=Ralstonia sp. A12 TaxID=1217052 RepID=UPI001E2F84BF|nr:hypothetical protein [Ralstonia sp. A12]